MTRDPLNPERSAKKLYRGYTKGEMNLNEKRKTLAKPLNFVVQKIQPIITKPKEMRLQQQNHPIQPGAFALTYITDLTDNNEKAWIRNKIKFLLPPDQETFITTHEIKKQTAEKNQRTKEQLKPTTLSQPRQTYSKKRHNWQSLQPQQNLQLEQIFPSKTNCRIAKRLILRIARRGNCFESIQNIAKSIKTKKSRAFKIRCFLVKHKIINRTLIGGKTTYKLNKNWTIISPKELDDAKLTPATTNIAHSLIQHNNKPLTLNEIAKLSNTCIRTAHNAIKRLANAKLLTIHARQGKSNIHSLKLSIMNFVGNTLAKCKLHPCKKFARNKEYFLKKIKDHPAYAKTPKIPNNTPKHFLHPSTLCIN